MLIQPQKLLLTYNWFLCYTDILNLISMIGTLCDKYLPVKRRTKNAQRY
jgi:hypothetical protein